MIAHPGPWTIIKGDVVDGNGEPVIEFAGDSGGPEGFSTKHAELQTLAVPKMRALLKQIWECVSQSAEWRISLVPDTHEIFQGQFDKESYLRDAREFDQKLKAVREAAWKLYEETEGPK